VRAKLVEKGHPKLSLRQQCEILGVSRSTLAYQPVEESEEDRKIMRIMDETYLKDPCLGSHRLDPMLERDHGLVVNRKRIQRLRRKMGIETIWCKPKRTSLPDNGHRKYPYLLSQRKVKEADKVWCADITYIPMPHGHAYLCAVMDWHSRCVLGWAVSNTMDSHLTGLAFQRAVARGQKLPEIFNTDQGSQFTSPEWTGRLEALGVAVSMDGKGRWMDNLFIERLWRSLKYEDIYLKGYEDIAALEAGLREWMSRYNTWRPHQNLNNRTPSQSYAQDRPEQVPAGTNKVAV